MRRMRLSSNSRPRGRELCMFLTTFVTSSLCLKGNASMLQTSWKEPDGQTSAGGGFHEVHDIPPNKLCFFHMENSMYTSQGLSSIHEVHHWKMVSGQDSTQHRILKVLKLRKKVRCLNWFSFRVTCVWLQTFACDHVSYLVFFRRYRKHAHTHTHIAQVWLIVVKQYWLGKIQEWVLLCVVDLPTYEMSLWAIGWRWLILQIWTFRVTCWFSILH